jgi:hypothetical protein
MRIACWITKATNTHSYVILTAFLKQLWLHERASCYVLCTWPVLLFTQDLRKVYGSPGRAGPQLIKGKYD